MINLTFAPSGQQSYLLGVLWGDSFLRDYFSNSLLGLGFLAYGVLFVKSKAVPPIFGWIGVISGILLSGGVWLPRYDESLYSLFVILASPLGLWQLALGIWLITKGVREDKLSTLKQG